MKWRNFKYLLILAWSLHGYGFVSAQVKDVTPPLEPVLSYVTVDTANNHVNIFWKKSPSTDVAGYSIYYEVWDVDRYKGQKIDSVPFTNLSYKDTSGLAGKKSVLYSVSAFDSSGNESTRTPMQSTIYTSVVYDSCGSKFIIHWNKYQGWGNYVSGYRVYAKVENGILHLKINKKEEETKKPKIIEIK